ncbi:MAG TPA: hypothetical protein VM715_14940 [Candidatus Acidoferrum sp.]|nr:hypothetical protein [Candidatus Acidoferrum sp.]
MPSKPSPEPILGRINCVRCTRWRYLIDFPSRWYKTKAGREWRRENVCEYCRKASSAESYNKLSPEEKQARWARTNKQRQDKVKMVTEAKALRREVTGKLNGRLVTIVPFRMWLVKKLHQYGSIEELRNRTGLGHRQLTKYVKGYEWNESITCDPKPILTVPIAIVDKALTNEGSDSLRGIGYE